jgi:uncharacterized protein YndB with AHSA1/START domain
MLKIELSVVINRPVEEVFAFTTDIEKMTQWVGELQESKNISEGTVGVDTTFTHVVGFLGRRFEQNHKVIEYEPNRKLRFGATSGPIRSEIDITFESIEGGTKVTFAGGGEVGGFFKIAEPLLQRMFKRQWEANLANLKDLLEAQA